MTKVAKFFFLGSAIAAIAVLSGCNGIFIRSSPSEAEYIEEFFPMVKKSDEVTLRFFYKGGVGGYGTIAKINARESIVKRIVEEKSQGIPPAGFSYKMTMERLSFRIEELFSGNSIPEWTKPRGHEAYQFTEIEMKGKKIEIFAKIDFTEAFFIEIGE